MKKRKTAQIVILSVVACSSILMANMDNSEVVEVPYAIPSIGEETENALVEESLRNLENVRVQNNRVFIVEDELVDNAPKTYELKTLVVEFEKKMNGLGNKSYILIPQEQSLEMRLTNIQYTALMESKDVDEFARNLSEITNYNITNHVSYRGEQEEIVLVGNTINTLYTQSITIRTPIRAYRYLRRANVEEFNRAILELNEDEWFEFLYLANNDKELDIEKRVAGIRSVRFYLLSIDSQEARAYLPLLQDLSTVDDVNIAYLKRNKESGTINVVFNAYLYLLKNNGLTIDIKAILDTRILRHVDEVNKEGEFVNVELLYKALDNPTYKMIETLKNAVEVIEKEKQLKADNKWKEKDVLRKEVLRESGSTVTQEEVVQSTEPEPIGQEITEEELEALENQNQSQSSWWKFW